MESGPRRFLEREGEATNAQTIIGEQIDTVRAEGREIPEARGRKLVFA